MGRVRKGNKETITRMVDSMFAALDEDASGTVAMSELVGVLFPKAIGDNREDIGKYHYCVSVFPFCFNRFIYFNFDNKNFFFFLLFLSSFFSVLYLMMDATPSNSSVDEDAVETGPVSDAVRTELKQLFDIYDIDKNGVLTVDELRNAMSSAFLFDAGDNLSPEASAVTTLDFERIVMSSDMNGDNEIDFEEWIHLMRHFFE